MPIVRHRARCGAPNAFQLRLAIRKLFLEHQCSRRSFTSTPSIRDGTQAAKMNAEDIAQATASAEILSSERERPPDQVRNAGIERAPSKGHHFSGEPETARGGTYIDIKSLKVTLENIRKSNRDSVVKKIHSKRSTLADGQFKRPLHPELTPLRRAKNLAKTRPTKEAPAKSSPYEEPAEIDTLFPPYPPPGPKATRSNVRSTHLGLQKSAGVRTSGKPSRKNEDGHSVHSRNRGVGGHKYNQNQVALEVLEYEGRNVLPHSTIKTPQKDLPWMRGQDATWADER
jgi:hypothetical protein